MTLLKAETLYRPYTYSLANDPLYTTSWMLGLIDKSAGQAYKIAPTVKFLDDALEVGISAARYNTVTMPAVMNMILRLIIMYHRLKDLRSLLATAILFSL